MSSPSKETTTEKPVEVAKETKETVAATGEEKPKESVFAMKPGPFSFSTTATTSAKPAFSFAAPKLDAKEDDEAPQEEESDVPDVDTSGAHKTMEEDEDVLFTAYVYSIGLWSHYNSFSKLYRWDDKIKEWRESGTGEAKILKNKESGKIRFLMRREKVFKICGNHYGKCPHLHPSTHSSSNIYAYIPCHAC